jgi:hypothetical protein
MERIEARGALCVEHYKTPGWYTDTELNRMERLEAEGALCVEHYKMAATRQPYKRLPSGVPIGSENIQQIYIGAM